MNEGKLEVVKQEMARVNINVLGISELEWENQWTGMGEFNSDDHFIYCSGQEFHKRNGVVLIINRRVWNAVLGRNLKNDRMISIHFQGKPFNITAIQVYAPTTNAKEAEVERFYEDPQDLLELTPKKDVLFSIGDRNAKVRSQEIPGVRQVWPRNTKWSKAKVNRILQETAVVIVTQEMIWHINITKWWITKSGWLHSLQPKMKRLYTANKNKTWSWLWHRSSDPHSNSGLN